MVVVGNISLGGTGKTPLVINLCQYFHAQGKKVGVVLRGYGATISHFPHQVKSSDTAFDVGDEARLLFDALNPVKIPVVIDPKRARAVQYIEKLGEVSMVFCDDGLQHYSLNRDLELLVIDGERRLGNGLLLPAGPLREPASRLQQVDMIIAKGTGKAGEYSMAIKATHYRELSNGKKLALSAFKGKTVHAIAGIGNPLSFFNTLKALGVKLIPHVFDDHHSYQREDLDLGDEYPIIMTAKDAVKCLDFKLKNLYYLEVNAVLDAQFYEDLQAKLHKITKNQKRSELNNG